MDTISIFWKINNIELLDNLDNLYFGFFTT